MFNIKGLHTWSKNIFYTIIIFGNKCVVVDYRLKEQYICKYILLYYGYCSTSYLANNNVKL